MPGDHFLGTGMKFPPQINPATGRFAVSSEEESVKESVYLILMTQKTERFLRPEFGSDLMIQSVSITTDEQVRKGCLLVNIDYVIRSSQVSDHLDVPLYLHASPEEEAYEPEQYETDQWE